MNEPHYFYNYKYSQHNTTADQNELQKEPGSDTID